MSGKRAKARRKQFAGLDPVEFYWRALGEKCPCGRVARLEVKLFAPLEYFSDRADELAAIAAQHGGKVPVIRIKDGKAVKVGQGYACHLHASTLEKMAAKAHSSWFAEFDRGPDPKKVRPHFQVPRGFN